MKVTVLKLVAPIVANMACSFTTGKESMIPLDKLYRCEHSPIRTQVFWVEMVGIPTFVSVHLVRHKIGVEHYVRSNREDRGGDKLANRNTPVDHAMFLNAQALINMARKRLCGSASKETQEVMHMIVAELSIVDPDLVQFLVPECVYRGGVCPELKSCGMRGKQKEIE